MTREEAIILIECAATELVGALAETKNDSEAKKLHRYIDAYDMAISALRQQDVTDKNVGKMTNADRIRAMSDGELVNWIADINPFYCQTCVYAKPCRLEYDEETVNYAEKYDCKDGILKWLQQPAEEEEHDRRTEIKH